MAQSFKCPSCSAPLEYEGSRAQKCPFCGGTVVVDSEVRSHFNEKPDFGVGSLLDQAQRLKEVKSLIQSGNKIAAIKEYREIFNCGLAEAKNAVDDIEAGRPIVFSAYQSGHPAEIKLPFADVDTETVTRAVEKTGRSVTAIIMGVFAVTAIFIVMLYIFIPSEKKQQQGFVQPTPVPRNTPTPTPAPTRSYAKEVARFGGKGIGPGQFKDNRSIAVDAEGNIYSGDYSDGGRIQVLDPQGNFKRQIEIDDDRVLRDLALDRAGNLFVVMSSDILRYEAATGKLLGTIGKRVNDLTVGLDGLIYATTLSGDIVAMTPEGNETKRFKSVASQASLKQVSLEQITLDGQGNMYVIERMKYYILKFNREGKFLTRIGGRNEPGEPKIQGMFDSFPADVVIDNKGNLYASNIGDIYVFNSEGGYIDSFKSTQSFGMTITDKNELWIACRPYVVKYQLP